MEAIVIHVLWMVVFVRGEEGCRQLEYLDCIKNKTLAGHVFKTIRMLEPGLHDCQHQCFMNNTCISYNLGPIFGVIRSCELSDTNHVAHPNDVIPAEGAEYCPIVNPCSHHSCPSYTLCKPDIYMTSYTCSGWTSWGSWLPCALSDCPRTRTRNCTAPLNMRNSSDVCVGANTTTDNRPCVISPVDSTDCIDPLGMENFNITMDQVSASSYVYSGNGPWFGRLNNRDLTQDTWAAENNQLGEYLEIDFLAVTRVTKVATQGRPTKKEWVTSYSLSYTNKSIGAWRDYEGYCKKEFAGNTEQFQVVSHVLEVPITARHIRFVVMSFYGWVSMRVEVYGCETQQKNLN